jgi:hypothetical protein
MVNVRKINIYMPIGVAEEMTGRSGCLRSDGVYSARRLRPCDKLPPPAKPCGGCAEMGARLSINPDGGQVMSATARMEHLM